VYSHELTFEWATMFFKSCARYSTYSCYLATISPNNLNKSFHRNNYERVVNWRVVVNSHIFEQVFNYVFILLDLENMGVSI